MIPILTDTVMKIQINKEDVFNNAMIRDILVENPQSVKSDALMEKLEERLIPMPDSMMAEIQQGLETIGAKEDVEHDLAAQKQQYENAVKQMIRIYAEDTTGNYGLDSLLVLVNGENKLHSAYDAVSLYLSKGAFSEGMALLNNIPSTFSLTPEQNSEHAIYQDLFPIVQQMISDSQGLGSVNSVQAGMLSSMTENGAGPVAAYARNILIKRGTVQYEEPIINLAPTKETRRWKINKPVAKKVEDWQIRVFPNPSRNFVIVEYRYLIKESGGDDVTLSITDMNGHKVYDRKLIKSYDQVVLSTEAIQPGTYLVNLNRKGVSLGNTKLIIQK